MIDKAVIDRIHEAADIVDVVQDYISLRKRGVNYVACCPFHEEKTPSFSVSPAKNIFKCFGCGKSGRAVDFVMEHERVSYVEAVKILARKYGIEIEEKVFTPQEAQQHSDRESMLALAAFAADYFARTFREHPEGKAVAQTYCAERGIAPALAQRFQLGYCLNQRGAFAQAALKAGYKKEFLVKTGLCTQHEDGNITDRFAGRLIFPIHSVSGRVAGFGGRSLSAKAAAKYINSKESDIYHKSGTLYGIFLAKKSITQHDKCYLVEGYTDVIAMHSAGIENAAASSGTALTADQIKLLKRFTANVTLLYDGDEAGIRASLRGIDMLLEAGFNVKTLLLPAGDDPDSFIKSRSATEFREYLEHNEEDFIRFKIKTLLNEAGDDPVKKAAAAASIVQSIALIADHITRSVYVLECANLVGMDEATLAYETGRVRRRKYFGEGAPAAERAMDEPPPPSEPPPLPSAPADTDPCHYQERELVYYMLKYGQMPLGNGSVGSYIVEQIDGDDIILRSPEYRQIFDEYRQILNGGGIAAAEDFLHHSSTAIRRLAADLLASSPLSKYLLHKIYAVPLPEEEQLSVAVPKALNAYKARILELAVRNKIPLLKEYIEDDDDTELAELPEQRAHIKDINNIDGVRNEISHMLNRVVL